MIVMVSRTPEIHPELGAKYTDIGVIVRLISTEELRFLSAFLSFLAHNH